MNYTAEMIRGIPSKSEDFVEYYQDIFSAKAGLFQFAANSNRTDDDMLELSINWFDDDGAITNILECKRGDDIKYKGGAAVISRKRFDEVFSKYMISKVVAYERNPIPEDNEYHGNILVSKTKIKNLKGIISSTLAIIVDRIEKAHRPG